MSGLDLSPVQLTPTLGVKFRLFAEADSGALVCPGTAAGQPTACEPYDGSSGILIYTAENNDNHFSIQAQLFPISVEEPLPLFVVGDCEWDQSKPTKKWVMDDDQNDLREVGDTVNFWGAQWWKNNCMSDFISNGYPAFKGFATNALVDLTESQGNCGQWQARPGNSGHPPATIADEILIIVTDNVIKDGPNISGNIKQIVKVNRKVPDVGDNYAGNPGHRGWGTITQLVCGPVPN